MVTAMKTSGIAWIKDIPVDWDVKKIKYVASIFTGNSISDDDKAQYEDASAEVYPYISSKDITLDTCTVDYANGMYTPKTNRQFRIAKKGCSLVCIEGGSAGRKMAYLDEDVSFVNKLCCFEALPIMHPKYLNYYLQTDSFSEEFQLHISGLIGGVSQGELRNFAIVVPSVLEQRAIAAFLDDRCRYLDGIVADLERQVKILRQYKKALITETVTKGLDKTVPMKDSGIDWIGEIPIRWEINNLRYLGSFQNGISKDGDSFGSGFPFVSYGDVYNNFILPTAVEGLVESNINERRLYSVQAGDVLFTRTSETIEEIGFASVCRETIKYATFAGFLIRFRPTSKDLLPGFATYYFRADALRSYFVKEMMIVTRASLGQNLLKNLPVLLPPIDEQQKIANFLDNKCAETDTLIAEKQRSIETMWQYKRSLIYEYVTGKKRVAH